MKSPGSWVWSLLLTLGILGVAEATVFRRLSLEALIDQSEMIVYGRVMGNRSFWDDSTQTIWTETVLFALDAPKGESGKAIVIQEPGGTIGTYGVYVPGVPRFEVNQEIVVFLYRGGENRNRVLGLQQGVFRVESNSQQAARMVRPSVPLAQAVYSKGTSVPTMLPNANAPQDLSGFLHAIRERLGER